MEMQEAAERLQALQLMLQQKKCTAEECATAMYTIAPVLEKVWQQTVGNDALWVARIDGSAYRDVPVLGHFRLYRRFRVWWLRRQLFL